MSVALPERASGLPGDAGPSSGQAIATGPVSPSLTAGMRILETGTLFRSIKAYTLENSRACDRLGREVSMVYHMNLHISGDAERIIRLKLESGRFASESEVVEEALRLLDQQGQSRSAGLALTEEEFQRHLVDLGLMIALPDTGADVDDPEDELIGIEGEPLSETVIRERR
jgi:Arc/MetJ-type ribon-helix-helix transcriptional regulator